jgi:hypothetical protein
LEPDASGKMRRRSRGAAAFKRKAGSGDPGYTEAPRTRDYKAPKPRPAYRVTDTKMETRALRRTSLAIMVPAGGGLPPRTRVTECLRMRNCQPWPNPATNAAVGDRGAETGRVARERWSWGRPPRSRRVPITGPKQERDTATGESAQEQRGRRAEAFVDVRGRDSRLNSVAAASCSQRRYEHDSWRA